jgi:hypothetical protein
MRITSSTAGVIRFEETSLRGHQRLPDIRPAPAHARFKEVLPRPRNSPHAERPRRHGMSAESGSPPRRKQGPDDETYESADSVFQAS